MAAWVAPPCWIIARGNLTASIEPRGLPRMPPVITRKRSSVIFVHEKKSPNVTFLKPKKNMRMWKRIENHSHRKSQLFQMNGKSFTEPSTLTLGFKSRLKNVPLFLGGGASVLPKTEIRSEKHTPQKKVCSPWTAPSRMDLHRLIQCCHGYQAATGLGYQALKSSIKKTSHRKGLTWHHDNGKKWPVSWM